MDRSEERESAIVSAFVLLLIVTSFPGKFLFYAAPLLCLRLMTRRVSLVSAQWFFIMMGCMSGLGFVSVLCDFVAGQLVSWWGIVFGAYTYSTMVMLAAASRTTALSSRTYERIAYVCARFMILESLLGFVEFAIKRNGDYVSGSFGITDLLTGKLTISQVNYTFNLFMMIVFCLPLIRRPLIMAGVTLALLACAMAQSGHQTIFFVATAVILGASNIGYLRKFGLLLVPLAFIVLNVIIFYPETGHYASEWFRKVVTDDHSLKRQIISDSLSYLSDPKNFMLGIGLGQFTSRAAQFVAGDSISVPLPGFISGESGYYDHSIRPLLYAYSRMGEGSAMSKPYFSVLSILTEFGPPVAIGIAAWFCMEFRRNSRSLNSSDAIAGSAGYYCNFLLVFLLLCSFIEDYLELTQAILIPAVLYVIAKGRLGRGSQVIARG